MQSSRRPGPTVRVRVEEYAGGVRRVREDRLAAEEPLEVRLTWPGVTDRRVGVTMRTPGHDFELAAGLLHAEGLLSPGTIEAVAYCTDVRLSAEERLNVVTVALHSPPPREIEERPDTVTASSSACGVCGTRSIEEVQALARLDGAGPRTDQPHARVAAETLVALPDRMRAAQQVFERTGGLHAAGLFEADGTLLVLREDIGRHNAVDKVVGARILTGASPAAPLLGVSGRIGFEIVQKAAAARIGFVAAIGAPSSLAVRLAEQAGLGLVGFVSPDRFVVYAGGERLSGV